MDGVTNCIEHTCDLVRHNSWGHAGIIRRDHRIGSKAPVNVDPQQLSVGAYVPLTTTALEALPADNVRFATYELTDAVRCDAFAHLHDFAAKFVSNDSRWLDAVG